MMTLRLLSSSPAEVPSAVAWALADLGEARGKQELFTRQSPQRLKVLREHAPNSRRRVRFRAVDPKRVRPSIAEMVTLWDRCMTERWVHPLVGLAASNLDFLCIHPFRDGNGRVSRLLWLLQSYHLGYDVGRYISLERLVEQHKDRYYGTLELSSRGWHDGAHDTWPYINFGLFILKTAYHELEERLRQQA